MKKIYFLTVILLCLTGASFAQVTVSGSTGANATYTSLTQAGGAFAAINAAGSQAGNNILITITADVATEDGANQLNNGGWTTLTINPSGGAARTLSGSVNGPLVSFNGAANVTIDGLNAGGNFLTISNTSGGASASTIRFINDASGNTVTKCTLLGSSGNTLGTGFGIVYFGTGTVTGNDNNTITQCNISASAGGTPQNAIYSLGSSAVIDNSGNTISINNISDYFSAGTASAGMNINSNNSGWTITNNTFYQTATRTYTTAGTHNGIFITSGAGYTISNNVIGYATPAATGTTNMIGLTSGALGGTFPSAFTSGGTANATRYIGINCAFTAGGAVSSIQNNTVGGIALYTSSGATTANGILCGIQVTSGNANIGTVTGNTIGSATGTNSLYAASTSGGGIISGIYCTSTNAISIQNNIIGGINASGISASTGQGFKGIEGAGTGTYIISNNTIGSSVANNIRTGYLLTGANLSNVATTPTSTTGGAAIQGIVCSATGATASITGNTLRGFQISNSNGPFTGINTTGAVTGTIDVSNNNLGTSSLGLISIMFANSSGILCMNNSGGSAACAYTANNNIFQGVSYSAEGSGSFRCMNNSATLLSCTMNNNNFNNLTINSSGSTFGFLIGATSSTPTVVFNGNYVTTQFSNITTTGGANFLAIGCATPTTATGSTTITNNILSNITFRTTTSLGAGIYWNNGNVAGCTHNINISNNIVSNLTNNGTATTAALYGIVAGYGNTNVIANNTINGVYGKAQVIALLTNTTSGNAAGSFAVYGNTIYNISSSTASSQAQGIQCAAGPTQNIYKNKIYDITATGAGTVIGLIETSGAAGTTANIYNNYIGRLYAPNSGFYQAVRGITFGSTLANTANVYYNTVYLDGNSAVQSYCVYMNSTVPTFNLRNNIFVNNAVASGGYEQFGLFVVGTLGASYATTSNNNIIYAGTPGSLHLLYGDGAVNAVTNPQQTLAGFQAFVTPREANSKTELPPFLNTSSGIGGQYLHLNPSVATQAESGAVNIATYTDDYDGEIRQGNGGYVGTGTAPDIGADEIELLVDKVNPDINYTALTNTTCVSNPTFTATITDNSGINTVILTKPRVYYKTSANSNSLGVTNTNTTDGWKYVEASNAGSPFSFTIDYSLVFGGVAAGTTIQYFVTAQDLAVTPNVGINSGIFAVTPATVALTGAAFPIGGFINSYSINSAIPTSVTIGAAGTYTSLTGVNGLFADLNNKGLSGNTIANIIDPSVTETGINSLNQMANGCSGAAYTLTIKPNAAGTVLTGAFPNGQLIKIKSSNVIIDGSSNGSTSQDLAINNTSVTAPGVVLFGSTGTTPITNSTLKNCIINNGVNTSSAVIVSDGLTPATAGYFNNITIQNNNIQKAYVGLYTNAYPSSGNGSGLNINSNNLANGGVNALRIVGIYLQGIDGATVSGNTVGSFEVVSAENDVAIWLATGTVNTTVSGNTISTLAYTGASANAPVGINITSGVASSNNVISGNTISALTSSGTSASAVSGISLGFTTSGVTISGNKISNIKNTNATGYGANGIALSSTLTSNAATVYNNFIFDVAGMGFAGSGIADNGYGIIVTSGAGYKIYYNSVHLNSNQTTVTGLPSAINITSGVTAPGAIDLRDNIFANSQTVGTERYAIYSGAANTVFSNIDYNDYYTAGPNLGYIGANQSNLAAIQAGFGGNLNSLNVLPNFTSATDLHLVATSNCQLDGLGTPILGFTTDYDAQTRNTTAPDMGADEFTASFGTLAGLIGGHPNQVCASKTVSAAGTNYSTSACDLIARIVPSGASPVSGVINTCVTIEPLSPFPTFNAEPYVQRYYDIEPATSPSSSTATITLYYKDQEFIDFNANNPGWPDLPTSVLGNADPNIANLRVTQYHGSAITPWGPGNYTGPGAPILLSPGLTPGISSVFWNATDSRWEVTVKVSGFSGFYVHTNLFYPLPITLNYLNGIKQGGRHLLNWKVTCNTTPRATLTLERSGDARNFSSIYTITADALRCQQPFDYTDAQPLAGMNYYRLKMMDVDGKITYSNIIALLNATKGYEFVNIVPNPVTSNGVFKLNVSSAQVAKVDIVISDMQGRVVNRQTLSLIAGFNSIDMNVANLASGTYNISGITPDDKSRVIRFVKQ